MAKKKDHGVDVSRLLSAVEAARLSLVWQREQVLKDVRALAGGRYSQESARKRTFVNLRQLYVSIVGRNLIAKNPRVLLSSFDRAQKAALTASEQWVNEEIERLDLAQTFGRIVTNALFLVGIGKVAPATPGAAAVSGWTVRAGAPFFEHVEFDDFVFDHHCRDLREASFQGHRYRIPLRVAKDFDAFNEEGRDMLKESGHEPYNKQGDERIGMIGRGYLGMHDEFEAMVDLWEIYLPQYRLVMTFADDALSGAVSSRGGELAPLRVQQWVGPETGPYHFLGMQWLPGQALPKGPLQDLGDLDDMANGVYRKLARQVDRMKSIVLTKSEEDFNRIKATNDGQGTWVDDPKGAGEVTFRGAIQELTVIFAEVWNRFSLMGGNLMTMGGLGTQANTLGQEELLANQSNGQVASMQDATTKYVAEVTRAMLWYWWNDPTQVQKTSYSIPGMPEISTERRVFPWHYPVPGALKRSGPMPRLKVDPYSMRHKTPQQRLAALTQFMTQIYIPLAGLFQQRGITADLNAYLELVAKFGDEPEMLNLFTINAPPQQETSQGAGAGRMAGPSQTSREYIRRDAGGGGSQDQETQDVLANMRAAVSGANGQPAAM